MIEEYLNAGMKLAKYKLLKDNSFYANIPQVGKCRNARGLP